MVITDGMRSRRVRRRVRFQHVSRHLNDGQSRQSAAHDRRRGGRHRLAVPLDLDDLLEGRPVHPVDPGLAERTHDGVADRVEAPLLVALLASQDAVEVVRIRVQHGEAQ